MTSNFPLKNIIDGKAEGTVPVTERKKIKTHVYMDNVHLKTSQSNIEDAISWKGRALAYKAAYVVSEFPSVYPCLWKPGLILSSPYLRLRNPILDLMEIHFSNISHLSTIRRVSPLE